MTDSYETVCIMFGTRIPRRLYYDVKRYCVLREMTIAAFVADAVSERLNTTGATDRAAGRSAGTPAGTYRGGLSRRRAAS